MRNQNDVGKWKHFPRYWPFVRGIHRSPVKFPHKGQWRLSLMFSLMCAWTNGWANNRDAAKSRRQWLETPSCSFWRHCNVIGKCKYPPYKFCRHFLRAGWKVYGAFTRHLQIWFIITLQQFLLKMSMKKSPEVLALISMISSWRVHEYKVNYKFAVLLPPNADQHP